MSDDADELRAKRLTELQQDRAESDETVLAAEWRAAAEAMRPSRRRGRTATIAAAEVQALFERAVRRQIGDAEVPHVAIINAAHNWRALPRRRRQGSRLVDRPASTPSMTAPGTCRSRASNRPTSPWSGRARPFCSTSSPAFPPASAQDGR